MSPKYPYIEVQLSGEDGNAYAIVGRCRQAGELAPVSTGHSGITMEA